MCIDYDTAYRNYWSKKTVIAYSQNPALIQSNGAININTSIIATNTNEIGYEPVNRD